MKAHTHTDIVLIGGSAGSINVLMEIVRNLETTIDFPILIVVHRKADAESALEELLAIHSSLPLIEVYDKISLKQGYVYLAPADYHVLFENKELISLDYSEKVNYSRPSIDVTFQSAASVFGEGTTALLISGANSDGLEGMRCIHLKAGKVLVQDPATAEFAYMPQQVFAQLPVDEMLRPEDMATYINNLNTAY